MRTQTLATGKPGSSSQDGFTLLELMVVIVIIGLFSALFSVRIESVLSGGDLRYASRILMGEISKLRGEAAYTRTDHVLELDIAENTLSRPDLETNKMGFSDEPSKMRGTNNQVIKLPKGVDLQDVVVASKGKIQEGKALITFYANGTVDRALVHLRNEKNEAYTLEVNPLTAQVTLHDSYIDEKTEK